MRSSLAITGTFLCACMLILASLLSGFARERGPRVDVICPAPPSPVKLADHLLLAYELHITNFDSVPLTLKQLEIFSDGNNSQALKSFSGQTLSALLLEVGSNMMDDSRASQTIAPGKRTVIFLWLELPLGQQAPSALHHRLIFTTGAAGGKSNPATETILEDFPVLVSQDQVPVLRPPFDGGVWLAGELANDSGHRRSIAAIDGHIHTPERFAIDWVKVGPNGDSNHDGKVRNENYWGYGEPIHAVADGEVTKVLDGIADHQPGVNQQPVTLDNIAGNFVVVRIAPNRYVTFAHLQNGSIKVHPDESVRAGDVLGLLGNSGNSSGPHLHFQVTDGNSILQSEGMPFVFQEFTDFGPGSDFELNKHSSASRERSIPANNAVVEFKTLAAH